MLTNVRKLPLALLALIFGLNVIADNMPQPGLYDIEVRMQLGPNMPPQVHNEQKCITKDEFSDDPKTFMGQQPPGGPECKPVKYEIGNGKIDLEIQCSGITMVGTGTYSAQHFEMTNKMQGALQGLDISVTATGTYKGDC